MFTVIMAYLKKITSILFKNLPHKRIVHPLKTPFHTYIFLVAARFGKVREFHTGINSDKIVDCP